MIKDRNVLAFNLFHNVCLCSGQEFAKIIKLFLTQLSSEVEGTYNQREQILKFSQVDQGLKSIENVGVMNRLIILSKQGMNSFYEVLSHYQVQIIQENGYLCRDVKNSGFLSKYTYKNNCKLHSRPKRYTQLKSSTIEMWVL